MRRVSGAGWSTPAPAESFRRTDVPCRERSRADRFEALEAPRVRGIDPRIAASCAAAWPPDRTDPVQVLADPTRRGRLLEAARREAPGGAFHRAGRKSYRVGPKVASWPNILSEIPYQRPQVGPAFQPTL